MAQKIERQSSPSRGGLIRRFLLGDIEEDDQPIVALEEEPSKLIRIRPRGRSAVLPEEPEVAFALDTRPAPWVAPAPEPAAELAADPVAKVRPSPAPAPEPTGAVLDATAALLLRRVERLETGLQLMAGAMKRSHIELVSLTEDSRAAAQEAVRAASAAPAEIEAAARALREAVTEVRKEQDADLQELRRAVSETSGAMESRITRTVDGARAERSTPAPDPALAGQLEALKSSVDRLVEVTQAIPLVLASSAERLAERIEASRADIEENLIAVLSVPTDGEGMRMLKEGPARRPRATSRQVTAEDAKSIWE